MIHELLQRILPLGCQLLWDDWRQQPAVRIEDLDGDGKVELLVSYRFQEEAFTTIFKHNDIFWYAAPTLRAEQPKKGKRMELFPASVRGIYETKWGYINQKGKFASPVKYDEARDFQDNGLAVVKMHGKYGLINRFGQFIIYPKYLSMNPFSEGRAIVKDEEGYKVINERGKEITKKAYSFLWDYHEGRARFSGRNEAGQFGYGYLNKQGKEVISAQFDSVTDFNDGRAVVKRIDGNYELIDRKGRTLQSYDYSTVRDYSEGLMAFRPEGSQKYGYINEEGLIVIQPAFTEARPFNNGRAIVNVGESFSPQFGLIDKNGKFIIEPIYNEILMLGDDRVAVGKPMHENIPYLGSLFAIADWNGNILTDFQYTNVLKFEKGYASVSDRDQTFFINQNGQVAKHLPIAKGEGTFTFEGPLIKGMIDNRLRYYNHKGVLIWSQNQIIPLNNRHRVIERKHKPNKDYLVYYPQIQGIRSDTEQKKVNDRLAELAGVKEISPNQQLSYSFTSNFEIFFFKNRLVVLQINSNVYSFGTPHGIPIKMFAHIDLESGAMYELKDLFKPNSSYGVVLSEIIKEQLRINPDANPLVNPNAIKEITPNQKFYVDDNHLYIYFNPYEIAAYAAGFPTFRIPFSEIDSIINKSGAFWRAFH